MQSAQAVASYRRALELAPHSAIFHSNLVYQLNFVSDGDAEAIFAGHSDGRTPCRRFGRADAQPMRSGSRSREPAANRLRLAQFREHAISVFFEPILESHDRNRFEVVCYSDAARADSTTERLREFADRWHDTARLTDEQLAQLIRQDQVDILVDLSGHIANHRLLTFARKPAPIQVSISAIRIRPACRPSTIG